MNRYGLVFLILGVGLAILLLTGDNSRIMGLDKDQFGHLVYLLPLALVLSAGIWRSRHAYGQAARNLMIWVVIILALVSVYVYRNDALAFGNRLMAGLVPGRAVVVTASNGDQEVVLNKMMSGHFEAGVSVNGHRIPMMIDTGASLIALSQEDAVKAGIDLDSLSYTMTVTTANGRTLAAPVTLDEVSIGPIVRRNVAASVARDGSLDESLLGMSFLGSLGSLQMKTDELRMRD